MININNDTQIPEYNVPIGSIVQTIQNENGVGIKFADGTLICYTAPYNNTYPCATRRL